jgi:hypothetical protein
MAETSPSNYKLFKSLSTDTVELYNESVRFLQDKFKTNSTIFTLASPFGQILTVLHNLTQLILYYIEDSISELNILEAARASTVYSLAALSGHNPSRAVSASGTILIKPNPNADLSDIPGAKLILTNYMNLTCLTNGLNYVVDLPGDELTVSLVGNKAGISLPVKQGRIQQQQSTSTGNPFQSIQIGFPNNFLIDNFLVNVFINGEKWIKYDSMLDIPRGAPGYICRTGVTNGLDIFFGNGSFGKIPEDGARIIVEYLVTEGALGNIELDNLSQIVFTFSDPALTTLGEELDLSTLITVTTTNAPQFGTDPESLALTRLIAPKASKNFALVNLDNYEILLKKLQLFSSVRVSLDEKDNRVINLFLVPDITKIFNRSTDYFNLIENKFKLTDFQKNELLKYIEKSGTKLISTTIKILDPKPSKYVLNIGLVTFEGFDKDSIKTKILDSVAKYFINSVRKDRIPKSDLIKLIEGIEGIDSVSIQIIGERNELSAINSKRAAPPMVGLDEFNDIIIGVDEFAMVRGGFKDRAGNEYVAGFSDDKLGAINLFFKGETQIRKY